MTHVISMGCAVLMVITVSESLFPDEKDCPAQRSMTSSLNQSESLETSLENPGNEILECSCVDQSCQTLCCPTGQIITNLDFHDITPVENRSILEVSVYNDSKAFQEHSLKLRLVDMDDQKSNPCEGSKMVQIRLEPYKRLENGSIYLGFSERIADIKEYFFGVADGNFVYTIEKCVLEDWAIAGLLDKLAVAPVIISIPCLLITFVVYCILPELRTIRGATLQGYVGPLAVSYTTIAVVSLAPEIKETSVTLCKFLAILMYSSGLASFFWLNVLCFHIWWTFEKSVPSQSGVSKWQRKKFIIYSTYAWGSTFVITGVSLIMDFYPNLPKSLVKPEFGVTSCFFGSTEALALYYYGPVGVTVVFNTLFFVSTALQLLKHQKENAHHLRSKDSQCHNANRQRINIHLKFFIIMGISWLMDVASYLCNERPKYLWSATDFINKLQGVIILVMFVLTNNTKRTILKRLGWRDRKFDLNKLSRNAYSTSKSKIYTITSTTLSKNKAAK